MANQTVTIPCHTTPHPCHGWSYKLTVSVRNVHTLTAVGESDSFLSLFPSFCLSSANVAFTHLTPPFLSTPLYPLLFEELWQGVTASSCLLSVSLPLVSTPMRGQKGCILKDKWTRGPRQKKIFLTWDTLYWVSSSLICTACYAPAVVLAPVQCLIDSAALPSSSLSMYCSSALSFWQCGCNQT